MLKMSQLSLRQPERRQDGAGERNKQGGGGGVKQHLSPPLAKLNPLGVRVGVADVSQILPNGLDHSLAHSCSFRTAPTPTTTEIKHRTCLFRRLSDNGRTVNRFS